MHHNRFIRVFIGKMKTGDEITKQIKHGLVSVLVVNHNGMKFLPSFYESVFAQDYSDVEVIMVDNASSDGSIQYTREHYPHVQIVESQDNVGYAGGNNIGYAHSRGEYVLVINNDVSFESHLISDLLKAFKEIPNLGAVQPKVMLMYDQEHLDACGSFWTNTGLNYHYGIYKKHSLPQYNQAFPVYSLKGMCMMIPRAVIEKIGLFDDDFWCYFEETDFCHRVWLAGYECWYYPKATLFHALGGTRSTKSEAFVQYHSFKNRLCSYVKNLGPLEMLKVLPVYILLSILWGIFYLLKWNIRGTFAIIQSFVWNAVHFGNTLRKRRNIQRHVRTVKDSNIFSLVRKNPRISYYFNLLGSLKNYED